MKREYCKDCHWWESSAEWFGSPLIQDPIHADGKAVVIGTCHITHQFTATTEDDWCGEFKAKEK